MGRKKRTLSKEFYLAYWYNRLTNLVCNMFEWKNLPSEINKSAMEKSIMLGAFSIFFKDKQLDKFFCLPGNLEGIDVYGYPSKATPIPKNGDIRFNSLNVSTVDDNADGVIIYANTTRTSADLYIQDYADKLSDLDIAIKMNTQAMKHPVVIKAQEHTKDSFNTLMHQYDDSYYVIIGDKSLSMADIDTLNLNVSAQEILDLQKQKETVMNEFYQVFGISGSVEKRERMIAGEMNAMMQQIGINREMWLSTRQMACERINKIFNLNVSVDTVKINFSDENNEGGTGNE